MSHDQVHALAEACGEHGNLIRVLAYTGLRWGEATALRVQDVDLARCRLTVATNAVLVRGHVVLGTPKTHRRRTVPFPEFLHSVIQLRTLGKNGTDLVFGAPGGGHLVTPTVRDRSWFDRALEDAGLETMTIHDLRHTAASLAVSASGNVKAVQKMLGHASAAMTLDTYADLFDDDLNAVATRLNHAALTSVVVKKWSEAADNPSLNDGGEGGLPSNLGPGSEGGT